MDPETREPVAGTWGEFLPAALFGTVTAYGVTAFLINFHTQAHHLILIGVAALLVCQIGAVIVFDGFLGDARRRLWRNWVAILVVFLVLVMTVSAMAIVLQFPGLFSRRIIVMSPVNLAVFALLSIVTLIGTWIFSQSGFGSHFIAGSRPALAGRLAAESRYGLVLAMLFFLMYFIFAETINFPGYRTLDLYFDFDISDWLARLSAPLSNEFPPVRLVHPAVLLFLRPPIWFLSLFLNGDRLQALFLFHALIGASCVFMVWQIAKQITLNTTFSVLIAAILGMSTSHLLLGSMVETYIYSAFGLILFNLLVHNKMTSLRFLVPAGLVITGITLSNFIQAFVLYLSARPSLKDVIKFVFSIAFLILALNLVEKQIYPKAHQPIATSAIDRELNYIHYPDPGSWKFIGRVSLMTRAVALYGIVAPAPFVLDDELGLAGIPHFRTYQITVGQFHVAGYSGFGDPAVKFWIVLAALAFVLFAPRFVKSPSSHLVPLALLLCIGFNLILHTLYGDDPLLYSPDWVYALVIFLAHAFQPWANRKWLHLALAFLFGSLIVTNLGIIHHIAEISAPLYSR